LTPSCIREWREIAVHMCCSLLVAVVVSCMILLDESCLYVPSGVVYR
jgi:hypothetical protein